MKVRNSILTALLSAAAACSAGADQDGEAGAVDAGPESAPVVGVPGPTGAANPTSDARSASPAVALSQSANPSAPRPPVPAAATLSMVIRTGEATIEVDSLETAVQAVRSLAARLGGYVGDGAVSAGEDQPREARLELKVPAARWDEALDGLAPLGRVRTVSSSAQDVGEEYTDLQARVSNAQRLEARLLELLATRTGKLEEVLTVERELARVREEIETTQGRMRFLGARAALSTLTLNLREAAPLIAPGTGFPFADALRQAGRNFVAVVGGLIAMLGWLLPLGLIALVALRFGRPLLLLSRRPRFGPAVDRPADHPAGRPAAGPRTSDEGVAAVRPGQRTSEAEASEVGAGR